MFASKNVQDSMDSQVESKHRFDLEPTSNPGSSLQNLFTQSNGSRNTQVYSAFTIRGQKFKSYNVDMQS
jgi:hypothetical protein